MKKWERFIIYPFFLILLFMLFKSDQTNIVKNKLTIVNSKGKPVITLAATDIGSGKIVLYDKDNSLTTLIGNSGIALYAPGEKEQVWLGATRGERRAGCIQLSNKDGQIIAQIGGRETGGFVETFSSQGMPLAGLGSMNVPTGDSLDLVPAGGVVTYGLKGKPIASFGITDKGDGIFTLWDKNYKPTVEWPSKK